MGVKGFPGDKYSGRFALKKLGYDPIDELVKNHKRILEQIEYYEDIQLCRKVVVNSSGKERTYNQEVHMGLYDKLNKISETLIRYQYSRVPETINVNEERSLPIIVNLTNKGDVYKINESVGGDDE